MTMTIIKSVAIYSADCLKFLEEKVPERCA